jgi:hypothetical protein
MCNVIVLNAHAPSDEKADESKDSFYEEIEPVFLSFPQVPYENSIRRL